jgi:hypothetical protein
LFYGKLSGKSAILGHSMGGGSSFLAMQNNTNVTTMVTFAAANTNPSSMAAAKLVQKPSLVISGENDCVAKPAEHQKPMYDSLASLHKAYIEIKGGGHCYFANTNFNCSTGEGTCTPNPTISRAQQQSIAQFYAQKWLDYFLKDDCAAWQVFKDSTGLSNRINFQSNFDFNNPVVTSVGDDLTSTPATTYQWYKDGVLLPGENSQTLSQPTPGDYYVVVTYVNGCTYTSNTVSVIATGLVTNFNKQNISLAPNPVLDQLQINLPNNWQDELSLQIVDVAGRVLISKQINQHSANGIVIGVQDLVPGYYAVILTHNNLTISKSFIKQ